jgi:hypothetical protein
MLSVRWVVRVQFSPNKSLVRIPNKRYEFVTVIPGQKTVMTERMRAQQESEQPLNDIEIMVTVCDGAQRFSAPTHVKADATWDQGMEALRFQARAEFSGIEKYPPLAAAYTFKDESAQVMTSMDGVTRVSAHLIAAERPAVPVPVISQPAADGTVSVTVLMLVSRRRSCRRLLGTTCRLDLRAIGLR